MRSGRRVVLGCRRWSTACVLALTRTAPAALIIFALVLPANAQYWGNSWGGGGWRQQQQPYNPYGGYGGVCERGFVVYTQWSPSLLRRAQEEREERSEL